MNRKFNTKKYIKDVLNDRYALVIGNEIILDDKIAYVGYQSMDICNEMNVTSNVV